MSSLQPGSRHAAKLAAAASSAEHADIKADALIATLKAMSPAQAANYVQTNVTDLASAKTILKAFAKILVLLARDIN